MTFINNFTKINKDGTTENMGNINVVEIINIRTKDSKYYANHKIMGEIEIDEATFNQCQL